MPFLQHTRRPNVRLLSAFTHFGFAEIEESAKRGRVKQLFDEVSKDYDFMNDLMSLGLHRKWKDDFVNELKVKDKSRILDMAGGTGDIAFKIAKLHSDKSVQINVCDLSPKMIEEGKKKHNSLKDRWNADILWKIEDAENLSFDDNTFDIFTISFGIRNCTSPQKVLQEAYRVIKPGGSFSCLEFSNVNNQLFSFLYDYYSFKIIPIIGLLAARNWNAYQYLVESIRNFPCAHDFQTMIDECGFKNTKVNKKLDGIVAIHSGTK